MNPLLEVNLTDNVDGWASIIGKDGNFYIADTKRWIDKKILPNVDTSTKWNRFIYRKVNILVWRIMMDRLLTQSNLDFRGIDVPRTKCPICNLPVKQLDHLFIRCEVVARTRNVFLNG